MFTKIIHIIFKVLAIACYVTILLFSLVMAPILFGWTPVVVQSGSMEPAITTGSIIYYQKVDSIDDIKMGDVISFKPNDKPMTTHRLMEIDAQTGKLRTKGDNNPSMDPEIKIENVIGKVGEVMIPKLGFVIVYAKEPLIIALIALIIIGDVFLSNIYKHTKSSSEEIERNGSQ